MDYYSDLCYQTTASLMSGIADKKLTLTLQKYITHNQNIQQKKKDFSCF